VLPEARALFIIGRRWVTERHITIKVDAT